MIDASTIEAHLLSLSLEIWDQTVGCNKCNYVWWGENHTERMEDFHAVDCPLKGRSDVLEAWHNTGKCE